MVDSRLRVNPPCLFHCFVLVSAPGQENDNRVQQTIPEEFEEKELISKSIPDFCFPCAINYDGVQYSTFVLTDIDGKFRFGFCRYPPHAKHCLCILSYFPWFHTFYAVLDKVAQISSKENTFVGVTKFLKALNKLSIPAPGSKLYCVFSHEDGTQSFKVSVPDTSKLPCIPDNRNLTEYFAKVTPENMVNLFISMLFERRIIITSDKLSILTAVVHGSVSLLYPMQWQHIYIPILPAHLLDYCSAPMPFLLGVHASMMEKVYSMPLSEVVIFDADKNDMYMLPEDLETFPQRISSRLKKKLRHTDRALEDYVSLQFLNCLADLMGGYRESLKLLQTDKGEKIVFDDQLFLNSRTGATQVFLEHILNLQSFRQFIAGRLELLNDDQAVEDMFEQAINQRSLDAANETKVSKLKDQMKKSGGAIKKGGAAFKKSVDGSYSQLKFMAQDIDTKEFKRKIKDKVKDGYKGVMQITQKDSPGEERRWSPRLRRQVATHHSKSKSLKHQSLVGKPEDNIPHPKRPPPRPPRPASELFSPNKITDRVSPCSTTEMQRKVYTEKERTSSHSETDIASLIDDGLRSQRYGLMDTSSGSIEGHYSSSDSSMDHLEGFQNPAFVDRNSDLLFSLSADEEDIAFEQSSLLTCAEPYEKHTQRRKSPSLLTNEQYIKSNEHDKVVTSPSMNSLERQQVAIKKFDNQSGPFYTPADDLMNREMDHQIRKNPPSIIRKKPVTGKKPVVPPRPRLTSDSAPTSPTSPVRPVVPTRPASLKSPKKCIQETSNDEIRDLIFESDSSDTSVLNKSFLADLNFEDSPRESPSTRHPPSPVSLPLPSADLLGLEQSLFHETMQSLSPDTRSLMGDSNSPLPTFQSSKAFFEQRGSYPNYNIGNYRTVAQHVERGKVVNSTCSSNDLFADCFEEAKNIKYTPR